jgi:hypothetical protein
MASTTPLMTDFPVLASLPEKDIKDVLADERLTNAILFTVPAVTTALDEQEKLSEQNEELASECAREVFDSGLLFIVRVSFSTLYREKSCTSRRSPGSSIVDCISICHCPAHEGPMG